MIRPFLALAILLAAVPIHGAAAADLDMVPAPLNPAPNDTMSFFGSGWYIRGDLGYSRPQGPSGSYDGVPFSHLSLAGSAVAGGGVGYKISNWFRADVTGDYIFAGNIQANYSLPGCCAFSDKASLGGWAVLVNGYVDLGTWSGITPYVGGGVGYAFMEAAKFTGQELLPNALPVFTSYPQHNTGGFAWALAAGAALDVAPGVKIDFGYRYLNIADAALAADNFGVTPKLKSVGAHQFRIGVRYMFDN